MFKEKLVIDIMKRNYSKIQCLIGDTLELDIDVLANGEPFNIESFNVLIEQGLDNGNFNIQNTEITKNKNNFVCSLSNKFTNIKGKHFIDISLTKDNHKKTTFKIAFEVYEGAISENSQEQEIFISILGEIREEILKAKETKTELSSKIEEGDKTTSNLSSVINGANETKNELTIKMQEAQNSNQNLNTLLNTANSTKEELSSKIKESKATSSNLSGVINTANATKIELTSKVEEAKNINNNLIQNIQEGNIEQIKSNADDWIDFKQNGGAIGGESGIDINAYELRRRTGKIFIRSESKTASDGVYFAKDTLSAENDLAIQLGTPQRKWSSVWAGTSIKSEKGINTSLNGMLEQWGMILFEGQAGESYFQIEERFPTAFPSSLLNIQLTLMTNKYDVGKFTNVCVIDELGENQRPNESFKIHANYKSDGPWTFKLFWRAIGN